MNGRLARLVLLPALVVAGCSPPVALQNALQKQAEEVQIVKAHYARSVVQLLDTIEKLQLELLGRVEQEVKTQKYFEKELAKEPTRKTDPNLLIVAVQTEKMLDEYFDKKREEIRSRVATAKVEYLKLGQSIENIERINQAAREYVDSLVRLRRETRAMAQVVASRVSLAASGGALDVSKLDLLKLPDLLAPPR
jgi:hypothetical protein